MYIGANVQIKYTSNTTVIAVYTCMCIVGSNDSVEVPDANPPKQEENSFGGPKPMLPYSSMFIFGPTNP